MSIGDHWYRMLRKHTTQQQNQRQRLPTSVAARGLNVRTRAGPRSMHYAICRPAGEVTLDRFEIHVVM